MLSTFLPGPGTARRRTAALAAAVALGVAACSPGGDNVTAPETRPNLPQNPVQVPTLRQSAFIFDVNVRSGTVRITTPERPSLRSAIAGAASGPQLSLLGADVIQLQTSNFFASPVGSIQPNRVRVFFDVSIINRLGNVSLITPTFPTAPAGQNGVILFPFSTNVIETSGGVGTEGNTTVVVELPSSGAATPSIDWNGGAEPDRPAFPALPGAGGAPFNFFNDVSCASGSDVVSDCFRYETFGPVAAGAASVARRVGFDVDASVGEFRARLIAAADLSPGAVAPGTVTGAITSPQRGPLENVQVQISGLATPVLTDASGIYTATVGIGPRTVSIVTASLPAGCSTITPANGQAVTVTSGGTITQNYSVTCTAATGTVAGTVTRAGTGTQSLAGVTFRVNPDATGLTDVTGGTTGTPDSRAFSATVPIGVGAGAGAGVVTLENLPTDCAVTAPASGSAAYSGLTLGGTVSVAFTVTCTPPPAPPAAFVLRNQFGAIVSGAADLTVTWDPTECLPAENPFCPAVRNFSGAQGNFTLTGSAAGRITARSAQPTPNFGVATLGGTLPLVSWTAVETSSGGAGFSDAQALLVVRFTIGAGAPGTVTTASVIQEVNDPDGGNFTLTLLPAPGGNLRIVEGTLTIP